MILKYLHSNLYQLIYQYFHAFNVANANVFDRIFNTLIGHDMSNIRWIITFRNWSFSGVFHCVGKDDSIKLTKCNKSKEACDRVLFGTNRTLIFKIFFYLVIDDFETELFKIRQHFCCLPCLRVENSRKDLICQNFWVPTTYTCTQHALKKYQKGQ